MSHIMLSIVVSCIAVLQGCSNTAPTPALVRTQFVLPCMQKNSGLGLTAGTSGLLESLDASGDVMTASTTDNRTQTLVMPCQGIDDYYLIRAWATPGLCMYLENNTVSTRKCPGVCAYVGHDCDCSNTAAEGFVVAVTTDGKIGRVKNGKVDDTQFLLMKKPDGSAAQVVPRSQATTFDRIYSPVPITFQPPTTAAPTPAPTIYSPVPITFQPPTTAAPTPAPTFPFSQFLRFSDDTIAVSVDDSAQGLIMVKLTEFEPFKNESQSLSLTYFRLVKCTNSDSTASIIATFEGKCVNASAGQPPAPGNSPRRTRFLVSSGGSTPTPGPVLKITECPNASCNGVTSAECDCSEAEDFTFFINSTSRTVAVSDVNGTIANSNAPVWLKANGVGDPVALDAEGEATEFIVNDDVVVASRRRRRASA